MAANTMGNLVQLFVAGKLSRREFVAGALALGISAGAVDAVLASGGQADVPGGARAQGTPPVSGPTHTYPLTEETVTFRIAVPANPLVEDFATNTFTAWYEEKTNVHLEWDIVPSQEAQTRLNVMLASGDYPDLLMNFSPSPALQQVYGAQGVFLSMNDLIEQHGLHFKQVVEEYPRTLDVVTAADGGIYALPMVTDCDHCSMWHKLWIYQPWLDQLGLAMPQTTEEYAAALRAFKEQDANGNGQDDEIPLVSAVQSAATSLDSFFMNAFIANPGGDADWLSVQDGAVTAVYATPQWQAGLTYLAGLYAEGLISPETFTQDQDQLRRLGNNPEAPIVGSVPGVSPAAYMDINSLEGGRWTDYVTAPPLQGPDGVRFAAYDPYNPFRLGNFIISSACENPELAFQWADGLYEVETTMRSVFGVPGENWRWAEEGEVGIDGRPAIWKRLSSFAGVQNFCWRPTGPTYRPNWLRLGEAIDPAEADHNLEAILFRETKNNYAPYQQPAEMVLPPLFFTEEQAQQVAEMGTTIKDYVEQTFASAIIGQFDIDGQWEEYLATLEGMGLPQYLQIHQEVYDARNG
ncbi:MAG: extracellular solute-binding protein [Thermomicrobiales bacterium]